MPEQNTRRFRSALAKEIKQWQQDEVVSAEVAERLAAMYPVPLCDTKWITISLIVGAALVGISGLSFVSSNWQNINRVLKMALAVGTMLASYIGAWHCAYEPGKAPKLGHALIELGTLLFGACIWMVTQFLNFDTSLTAGLLYWAIGSTLVTIVTRSKFSCGLTILLLVSLQMSCCDIFASGTKQQISLCYVVPVLLGLIWLCARVRSRAALFLTLSSALWIIGMGSGTQGAGLVALGSAMFSTYFLWKDRWEWFVSPFFYLGGIAGLSGLFCMSFGSAVRSVGDLSFLLGLATVPVLFAGLLSKRARVGIICPFMFAVLACASQYYLAANVNLLTISSVSLFFIATTASIGIATKLNKMALTSIAVALALLQILTRFSCIHIDSTMLQTIVFAAVGAILISAGAMAERMRRKFLVHSHS